MRNPSTRQRVAALAVLGLPAQATGAQITQAYRRLARTTHPDATGRTDPGAARRFAEISDAYHLLTGNQAGQQAAVPGDPIRATRTTGTNGPTGTMRTTDTMRTSDTMRTRGTTGPTRATGTNEAPEQATPTRAHRRAHRRADRRAHRRARPSRPPIVAGPVTITAPAGGQTPWRRP